MWYIFSCLQTRKTFSGAENLEKVTLFESKQIFSWTALLEAICLLLLVVDETLTFVARFFVITTCLIYQSRRACKDWLMWYKIHIRIVHVFSRWWGCEWVCLSSSLVDDEMNDENSNDGKESSTSKRPFMMTLDGKEAQVLSTMQTIND